MYKLDTLDEQLIRLLEKDARQNSEDLAKQLNVSAATIRRRLKKLTKSEVVRITASVNPDRFGLPVIAVIALDVVPEKVQEIAQKLVEYTEVRWVSTTTGQFDIIIIVAFRSTHDLSEFTYSVVTGLEGLRRTETFICLDIKKSRFVEKS
ncbi:Lrp/AsnC family transcriptional regulator [Chloroflexota bacterium]